MAKTASLTMRIEPNVKASAEELFASMGITLTEAINMFVYKCLAVGGIPFDLKQPNWNQETIDAFEEGDKIAKGEIEAKYYTDVDQMFTDILSEE